VLTNAACAGAADDALMVRPAAANTRPNEDARRRVGPSRRQGIEAEK
jgi:hypothetical protein